MSWLAGIAGKAEDILNKLDQNAAVALSTVNESSRTKNSTKITKAYLDPERTDQLSQSLSVRPVAKSSTPAPVGNIKSAKVNSRSKSSGSNTAHPKTASGLPPVSSCVGKSDVATTDEQLIEFLNSSDAKGLDEVSILKKELMSQVNEMGLLVKNHRQLQKDHESLKTLYDGLKNKSSTSAFPAEADHGSVANKVQQLEASLLLKNEEIERLSERLNLALSRIQSADQAHTTQHRLEQMELENKRLLETNEETNQKYSDVLVQLEALSQQAQSARDSLLASQTEYATYKNKAKSILKSKDNMIAKLENRRGLDPSNETGSEESATRTDEDSYFYAEIHTLKNERELFQAEISQCLSQIEGLKEENNRLENELLSLRSINFDLQNILTKERQRVRVAQEENLQLSQTVSSLQLDLEREAMEKKKIQEKHHRTPSNHSMTRSSSSSDFQYQSTRQSPLPFSDSHSPEESDQLRTRITALSQSLLEKQSLINELSSEKQLHRIKIERLESQLQEMRSSISFSNVDGICSGTQSVVSSQPLYLSESPWDTSVALRMKRVYSQVDSLCCQFGIAMRQRPVLRLGFSAYVIILHIWVFFVLFTWAHNSSSPVDFHK